MRELSEVHHDLVPGTTLAAGLETGPENTEDELDTRFVEILDSTRRAHLAFNVPPDVFAAHLRDRLPAGIPPLIALRQMYTSDLYLACACARGDDHAFAVFEHRCLSPLDRILGAMGIRADVIAEVKQDIRTRVLVGNGKRPEILAFSGRGDMRGWVRIMAVRLALRHRSRDRREVHVEDDDLLQQITAHVSPDLDYKKPLYQQAFKRAFEAAMRALPDRERILLRQHHVDELTLDEMASLYRVHRSTVARLLARARALVLEATRAWMMSQLHVQSQELDSIMRMIRSQIEISLRDLRRGRRR